MAINKKLIHFKTKSVFNEKLANNEILDTSIVFIQDSKQIWTHGQLYNCYDQDLSKYLTEDDLKEINDSISTLQTDVSGLKTNKLDVTTASSTYATKSSLGSYVPITRKVNGVALNEDITITATDPNAATSKALSDAVTNLNNSITGVSNRVTTLEGDDAGSSVREIVIDEITDQVASGGTSFDSLQEIAAWLKDHPGEVGEMNAAIQNNADSISDLNTTTTNLMTMLDGKLDKTGGTITGGYDVLTIKRNTSSPSLIGYSNTDGYLGWIGFNSNKEPIIMESDLATIRTLIHSGNVGDYAAGGIVSKPTPASFNSKSDSIVGWYEWEDGAFEKPSTYMHGAYFGGHDTKYGFLLASSTRGSLYYRQYSDNTWLDWKTLAFTDSTVEAAKKLEDNTAYTAWGQTFFENGKPKSIQGGLSDVTYIRFLDGGTNGIYRGSSFASNQTATDISYVATGHYFYINGASAMTITEEGNVLVGTNYLDDAKFSVHGGLSAFYVSGHTITLDSVPSNGLVLGGNTHTLAQYLMDNGQFAIQAYRRNAVVALALNLNPLGGAVNVGGNLAPNANNSLSLGISNYRWSDVYSVNGNFSNAVSVGSTIMGIKPADGTYVRWKIVNSEGGLYVQSGTYDGTSPNGVINLTGINNEVLANLNVRATISNFSEGRVLIGGATDDGESALQVNNTMSIGASKTSFGLRFDRASFTAWIPDDYQYSHNMPFQLKKGDTVLGAFGHYLANGEYIAFIGANFGNPWFAINSEESAFNVLTNFNAGALIPTGQSLTIGDAVLEYDGGLKSSHNFIGNLTGTATKVSNALTFGSKTFDGSSAQTITASDLGLSAAIKYKGVTTTAISDESTTKTVVINSANHTASTGDVVFYGNKEFIWNGSKWEELGYSIDLSGYKTKQTAVSDPTASSSTSTTFIDTISQDTNGKITVTKKTLPTYTNVTKDTVSGWGFKTTDNNTTYTFASGTNGFTVTPSGGSAQTVTVTPSIAAATTSANGLMTKDMVTKLNGIATGANNYSLPLAASGTRGGIQLGYTASGANLPVSVSSEKAYVALTKTAVTTALGYTPPTSDTNTWRPIYNGVDSTATDTSASANAVKTAYDKAVSAYNLANGKTSNTGTVTSVATGAGLTGGTITTSGTIKANLKSETKSTLSSTSMGSTSSRQYAVGLDKDGYLSVNIPWTDTTYTLSSLGIGNVKNYDQSKAIKSITRSGTTFTYTCLDGTTGTFTQQDNNTTYSVMGAATASAAGSSGLVPAPAAGKQASFLRGDGTWAVPTNTTYSVATTSANGLMSSTDKSKLDGIASGATAVSSSTVSGWGFTKNAGTITGVTAGNGLTGGGTSGAVTLNVGAGTGISVEADTVSVKYGTAAGTACQGNDSRLSNSRPASDVYSWAKAATKPTYTWDEVTNKPDLSKAPFVLPEGYDEEWDGYSWTSDDIAGLISAIEEKRPIIVPENSYTYYIVQDAYYNPNVSIGVSWNMGAVMCTLEFIYNSDSLTYEFDNVSVKRLMTATDLGTSSNPAWIGGGKFSSISNVPISYKFLKCTITTSSSFSLASTSLSRGREIHIIVYNSSSAAVTVSLPTASPYVNLSEDVLIVPATGYAEINVISDGTKFYIRTLA